MQKSREQVGRKTARNKGFQATKNRPDGGFDSFYRGKLVVYSTPRFNKQF